MHLSNPIKYFLLVCHFAFSLQACGSGQSNENRPARVPPATMSEFPFPTDEPDVYQANLVVESGGVGDKWFVARRQGKRRIDFFETGELSRTRIDSDFIYLVDHRRKIFTRDPGNADPADGLTDIFFKGKEYREFEKLGTEGGLTTYKVAGIDGKGDVLIAVDEKSGMMMRQVFLRGVPDSLPFVYEVRDLKFEVDDSVFMPPPDFREVSLEKYRTPPQQIK